jgi:hypothetical protein
MLFLAHRFLSSWWWRSYIPPKRLFLQEPHGVTSQKTAFFIVTAVKTSDLTRDIITQIEIQCGHPRSWYFCASISPLYVYCACSMKRPRRITGPSCTQSALRSGNGVRPCKGRCRKIDNGWHKWMEVRREALHSFRTAEHQAFTCHVLIISLLALLITN